MKKQNFLIIGLILLAVISFIIFIMVSGSGDKGSFNTTKDIKTLINTINKDNKNLLPELETMKVNVKNIDEVTSYTGLKTNDGIESITVSVPVMTAQAYQVAIVKVKDGIDVEKIKQEMLDNIDMRRWICVSAEQLYITNSGNLIFSVMADKDIAKTVYNKPLLNRFVVNKKFYDRNEVSIAFTAKVNYEDKSKEILSVIKVEENDNLLSIKDKTVKAVDNVRKSKESGTNNSVNVISKLPSFILSPVICIIKWLDRHDLLPKSLIDDNLYYSTCIVSNLGSIHSGAIYHNLTDFGTSSILATIGEIKLEKVLIDGKMESKYLCEFGINIDERIADGVYFVKAVRLMQDILNEPKLLEESVNEKIKETTKFKY